MKKLINILTLGAALAISATTTAHAQATRWINDSFLNNCQWVVIPTNTTTGFNYTNVQYESYSGLPTGMSNVLSLNTNINGNIIPQWEKDVMVVPSTTGEVLSNYFISVMFNNTNLLLNTKPPGPYPIAPLTWYNTNGAFIYGSVTNSYTNSYGIVSSNISYYYPLPPITPIASATNTITLIFGKELMPGQYGTNGACDAFQVVLNPNGVAGTLFSTNLPNGFLVGCRSIRLLNVVSGTAFGTSPGTLINDIRLGGWSP